MVLHVRTRCLNFALVCLPALKWQTAALSATEGRRDAANRIHVQERRLATTDEEQPPEEAVKQDRLV
jgi:hypothetical protein